MSLELMQRTGGTQVAAQEQFKSIAEFRLAAQAFTNKINSLPSADSVDKTPDGNANTILISHIEMLLDEYFFGLWSTDNFKWSVIANEIVGSIDLILIHPVTNQPYKRVGAAAVQIMVDATPADVKADKHRKNQWALDPANKKSNALDMGFPKLKAECIKNAANSLGKLFGRDLNRKKADVFKPILKPKVEDEETKRIKFVIANATEPKHLAQFSGLELSEELTALLNEKIKSFRNGQI